MDVMLFFSLRKCDPMSKTSEAVIFSARIPFALFDSAKCFHLESAESLSRIMLLSSYQAGADNADSATFHWKHLGMLLNMIEAGCGSIVCPTLVVHTKLRPETPD